jgi:hypothetical protein
MTKDWTLKLDQPLRLYSLTAKKVFEAHELELLSDDCGNCDENWVGSHVKASGVLDEDSHDPLRAIFWVDGLEGQRQSLTGPLYTAYSDRPKLTGTLSLVQCKDVTLVKMDLNGPINVAKGGEFSGPLYDQKSVQLLCLDKRQGLRPGPVTVEGYLDYYGEDLDQREHHLISGDDCPFLGLSFLPIRIEGALDGNGKPAGLREILVRSKWKGSKQYRQDREAEMERSLNSLRDLTDKNRIYIVYTDDLEAAYRFVDGDKTKEIKTIQPKADLKVLVERFYGLK